MKIAAVKPYVVGTNGRNFTFVKVETDEGIHGLGEAGLTWKELAVAEAMNHLGEMITGEDPMRTEHIWQVMLRGALAEIEGIMPWPELLQVLESYY